MKLYLSFAFITFFILQGSGQVDLQDGQNSMLIPLKENSAMTGVEGTPYHKEDFVFGKIAMEGKEPLEVFLRYNVHQEQIEIKTDLQSENVYLLPRKESTIYKFGPEKLMLEQIVHEGRKVWGYFIERYKGNNLRLLKKPVATLMEAEKAKTGYDEDKPARFDIDEEYYIIYQDGRVEKVRLKHRDVKKTFISPRAKKYLADHKVRSEEDLVAFISYLDNE